MLKIISTPIGNYGDITLSALEALKSSGCILCEDTRKTDILLKHHGILGKKLLIYNEYTTEKDLEHFITLAKTQTVCLVSDAGTPLICDPGHTIIAKARKNGVKIEIHGGVCSLIIGATLCGINIQNMLFLGFFNEKNTVNNPQEEITYSYFVAPHDIQKLLKSLELLNNYDISIKIAKDLTKEYEQYLEFNLQNAILHFNENPPKGEFVFFLKFNLNKPQNLAEMLALTLKTLPNWNQIGKKDLAKFLHTHCENLRGFSVKEIYNALQSNGF